LGGLQVLMPQNDLGHVSSGTPLRLGIASRVPSEVVAGKGNVRRAAEVPNKGPNGGVGEGKDIRFRDQILSGRGVVLQVMGVAWL
jgi:hypothetical protein